MVRAGNVLTLQAYTLSQSHTELTSDERKMASLFVEPLEGHVMLSWSCDRKRGHVIIRGKQMDGRTVQSCQKMSSEDKPEDFKSFFYPTWAMKKVVSLAEWASNNKLLVTFATASGFKLLSSAVILPFTCGAPPL